MERLTPQRHGPSATIIEGLAELFPALVTERIDEDGRPRPAIDFDLLRQELADHLVEGPQERYQLDWPGKRQALLTANAPIAKTLRPQPDQSVDFETTRNLFIEGDNLDALKLLQQSYLGKVKLIYIDPPYNTGNDFIYDDDFAATGAEYLAKSGQIDEDGNRLRANPESSGRFHSDWLSMMYPRLKLARNLLSDDGLIFISINDVELHNLLALCHEIFGRENHVNTFIWKKGGTGKNDSRYAIVEHEYIVAFTRDHLAGSLGLDREAKVTTSYNHEDENGRYSLVRLDSKTIRYSESLDFEIVGPDGTVYTPHRANADSKSCWRWSKSKVEAEYDALVFKDGFVYTKNYEKAGARPRSLLVEDRFGVTRTGRAEAEQALKVSGLFDFPKPVRLIEHLIRIVDDPEMLILDFFAGSGTTAEAAMRANARDGGSRRVISVQLAEPTHETALRHGYRTVADICRARMRGAAELVAASGAGADLDLGFRSLKVDSTAFSEVSRQPDGLAQEALLASADNLKPDRTADDLLFECLIEWGLELSMPITRELIAGHEIALVDDGALIACFDDEINAEVVSGIAKREPLRAVFRDSGFTSDSDRINAEQIFAEVSPLTEVKVI